MTPFLHTQNLTQGGSLARPVDGTRHESTPSLTTYDPGTGTDKAQHSSHVFVLEAVPKKQNNTRPHGSRPRPHTHTYTHPSQSLIGAGRFDTRPHRPRVHPPGNGAAWPCPYHGSLRTQQYHRWWHHGYASPFMPKRPVRPSVSRPPRVNETKPTMN